MREGIGSYKRNFFNSSTNQSKSLVQLFPHIHDQFITVNGMGGASRIEEYKNYISRIYVSFPFEYISEDIDKILGEFSSEQEEKIEKEIEKLYTNKLKPIVNYFFKNMLDWGETTMVAEIKTLNETKLVFKQYLRDIIHIKQNLWIKD